MSFSARIVGHRGGRTTPGDPWPRENTFAAFERAQREGADAIELDVRTCATGELVVFHDPDLSRVIGDPRRVEDVSFRELASFSIPLLGDVVRFCKERGLGLNVEMKHDVPSKTQVVDAMANALRDASGVLVSSFDPSMLLRLRNRAPSVPLAWLLTASRSWSPLAARIVSGPFFALHLQRTLATPRAIASARARGLRVGVWTVNDAADWRSLMNLGVDWIITDSPGRMPRR